MTTASLPATTFFALAAITPLLSAQHPAKCGFPDRAERAGAIAAAAPSDCGYFVTSPQPEYDPTFTYDIPVVFHVIQNTSGVGFLSAAQIQSQIDVLNEDFQAIAGSPGAPGVNTMIRFQLATVDPSGSPTTGITYSTDNVWFQDGGSYWNSLAWDTNRYLNVYTNNAGGYFGYVPDWPQGGIVGQKLDRVVVLWETVGKGAAIGPPFDMGRTLTHEVGHYFGLEHPFYGGCGTVSGCYTTGDLICDTNRQSTESYGCPGSKATCGSPDEIHNYMDYTNDPCMWEFTVEQTNRMRCTIQHWRPDLPLGGTPFAVTGVTPSTVEALEVGTGQVVTISGTGFGPASTVEVNGVPLTGIPKPYTVVDGSTITFDPPLPSALGAATVTVKDGADSGSTTLTYVANDPPRIQAGDGDSPVSVFSTSGLDLVGAGKPGDLFVVLASPDNVPTTLPLFSVDIGNGFTSLILVTSGVIGSAGSVQWNVPLSLSPLTVFYVEGLTVDALFTTPLPDTNTQQVNFVL